MTKSTAITVCALLFLAIPAWSQRAPRAERPPRTERPAQVDAGAFDGVDIDAFITAAMAAKHIPGLGAAIVKNGEVWWTGAYGWADVDLGAPVTDETLFMLASVSKTLTGATLMQLVDQGLLALDDPINDHLPFTAQHPGFPGTDITVRMLLTHTAGLKDNWGVMPYYPGDSPYALADYLQDYLELGGPLYNPNQNFTGWQPGTDFTYCNNGAALVGLLAQVVSGVAFEDVSAANLFGPLGMDATAWYLADLDVNQVALPYRWSGGSYVSYGHFGYSDYPSGQLRTSAPQLARFLSMIMAGGQHGTTTVLAEDTVAQMLTPQVPDIDPSQGLIFYSSNVDGRSVWGHNGGDQGVTTEMWFDPVTRLGVVALTNGEAYLPEIIDALFDHAEEEPPLTSLYVESAELSAATGGQVNLTTLGGSVNGGRQFVLLGSLTGTEPGMPLPGGHVTLPLVSDAFTSLGIQFINTPVFSNFHGTLGGSGVGRSTFNTLGPLPPDLVGFSFHFAGALRHPWNFVTNPVSIAVGP